jgi:hypothetical protein
VQLQALFFFLFFIFFPERFFDSLFLFNNSYPNTMLRQKVPGKTCLNGINAANFARPHAALHFRKINRLVEAKAVAYFWQPSNRR